MPSGWRSTRTSRSQALHHITGKRRSTGCQMHEHCQRQQESWPAPHRFADRDVEKTHNTECIERNWIDASVCMGFVQGRLHPCCLAGPNVHPTQDKQQKSGHRQPFTTYTRRANAPPPCKSAKPKNARRPSPHEFCCITTERAAAFERRGKPAERQLLPRAMILKKAVRNTSSKPTKRIKWTSLTC